ncbi:antileukoproteinase-like [Sorex araneus]|uniref:antileukoproteinase-like n=1 Tax=Sorex araneus TaxID=42254 RepID=UPI002433C68D|nr:antileukoproteinase-like [Sorex araneus]
MKSINLFSLGVLFLGTLAPWTVEGAQESVKAGNCPLVNVRCSKVENLQCQSDSQCPRNQKCCQVLCAMKCIEPVDLPTEAEKAGNCPPVNKSVRCFRYEKPQCQSDWQCTGNQKCCQDTCGIKCLDPVKLPTQAREKPGKCPQVYGECMMLNPPNHCETDSQCQGKLKCCKGMCGKACVRPVRDK